MKLKDLVKVKQKEIIQHYDDGDNGFDTGFNFACEEYDSKEIVVDVDKLVGILQLRYFKLIYPDIDEAGAKIVAGVLATTIADNLDKILRVR